VAVKSGHRLSEASIDKHRQWRNTMFNQIVIKSQIPKDTSDEAELRLGQIEAFLSEHLADDLTKDFMRLIRVHGQACFIEGGKGRIIESQRRFAS
jgi:hypothetical protein